MRVGIVGTGLHSLVHLAGYAMLPEVEVVAAVDAEPGRAAVFAAEHGIGGVFDSIEDMVASDDVDLVDIITPPLAHLDPVLTTLAAGKAVLCEKPLAIDVAEAADMVVAARKSGLVTATSFNRRFDPVIRYVRELVAGGHIGEHRLTTVQLLATWKAHSAENQGDYRGWLSSQATGGGFLRGAMPHYIDLLRFVLGEIDVDSSLFVSLDRVADDILIVAGRVKSAGAYSVAMTWTAAHEEGERWVVAGSERTLVIEPSGALTSVDRTGERETLSVPAQFVPDAVQGASGFGFGRTGSWAFAAQADQLARKLADPSFVTSYATFDDGLRSAELIEAIYMKANS